MYGFSLVLLGVAPCAEVGLEDSWTPTADVVPATERVDATEDPTPTEEPTLVEQPTPAAITTPAPSPRTVTLGVGGDTSFGRYIRNGDFRPFGSRADVQAFAPILSAPDWTMLNLEAPIYSEVPPRIKRSGGLGHSLIFRSAPETADWLKEAGVDALSTANNHVEDCGEEGREETRRQLKAREIPFAGTVTPGDPFDATIIKEEGFTIALFAWSTKRNYGKIEPGRAPADVAYVKFANVVSKAEAYVAKARANHPDALVVFSLHWGQEYTERPSYPQIRAARRLIEAGVDLVVGHHSHSLHPAEAWKDGLILYSLGNFFFDQSAGDNRGGAFVEATFTEGEGGWQATSFRATAIEPRGRTIAPRPLLEPNATKAKAALRGFASISSGPPYSTPVTLESHEATWSR